MEDKKKEIREIAIVVRDEIAKSKKLTTSHDINEIFLSAETLISSLAYLISPITEMEQVYRKLALRQGEESQASADSRAKASDEYKEWRKYSMLYELAEEQINVLKKFKSELELEYKRS